jgi:hypothetical protein
LLRAPAAGLVEFSGLVLPSGLKCSRERRFVVGSQPMPNARFKGVSRRFRDPAARTDKGQMFAFGKVAVAPIVLKKSGLKRP